VDYSKDFSVDKDDVRTERRRLTENFGNAKNKKMLEANIRRSITDVCFNNFLGLIYFKNNLEILE
jgi:hypothetical protein